MILQNLVQPKIVNKKNNTASIEIQGLYPGYGTTIGNSLRRVLLSSLQGSAITQVKIKGVNHEFSTIDGILEDVIVIMMNLKEVRFKQYDSEPQTATLKIKGEKKVRASDFNCPTQLEIVNPNAHILTLTDKKAEIEMEVQVEQGLGYETVEERRKQQKKEIGMILLDAIFSPVKKVSFNIENMRVGERTDYDRLVMEIKTDGTVLPEQAFSQAASILSEQFNFLAQAFVQEKPELKLDELNISEKTLNLLKENKVKKLDDLLKKTEKKLLDMPGLGDKALEEIKKALKKQKLELKS